VGRPGGDGDGDLSDVRRVCRGGCDRSVFQGILEGKAGDVVRHGQADPVPADLHRAGVIGVGDVFVIIRRVPVLVEVGQDAEGIGGCRGDPAEGAGRGFVTGQADFPGHQVQGCPDILVHLCHLFLGAEGRLLGEENAVEARQEDGRKDNPGQKFDDGEPRLSV